MIIRTQEDEISADKRMTDKIESLEQRLQVAVEALSDARQFVYQDAANICNDDLDEMFNKITATIELIQQSEGE